ncbi:ERF family protein [Streptococcus pneumoniae]|uniref:ERF family protein n=1 Tax=Streptococcus pneumoniae TaxID=1313 RepID=UPI0003C0E7BD|nr:ERF family protein [Streptococcus pneumoniae]ESP69898.1 putative Erf protein [Streptococcus pneumoniae BHN191]OLG22114.1 single-stranded DNA-binding protein [Streptococcus pneumoniae]CRC97767.1 phage single-strand DNA binding protein [Streptococcus pneumoniae]CRD29761.1 phage single-strand DNA binding protein [Streptococcus pneumoniae]CRD33420.1 phage single-strand DNA binding protein [Streptococcus pneumoniae]
MADLTFAELQRKMQLEKRKTKDVKYAFRNAEDIYTAFKELNSDWSVIASDELIEVAGRVFIQSTAFALDKEGNIKQQSTSFAELSTVPVFNTQKGQVKQMQDPQWTGAVSSYARKYALQGLFAIGEKDIDEYPVEESQEQNQVRYIDNIQYQEINDLINDIAKIKGMPFDTLANYVLSEKLKGLQDFHRVQVGDYEVLKNYLTEQLAKAKAKRGN